MRAARNLLVAGATAIALSAWADNHAVSDAEKARRLGNEAAQRAKEVKIQVKPAEYSDPARVRELGDVGRTRGQAELTRMIEERQAAEGQGSATVLAPTKSPPTALTGRLVVALSSSMPEAMLRDYMVQLDGRPEAIVVFRGFVGGAKTVGPTGKLIELARRKVASDPRAGHRSVETVVDPLVFRSLGIDRVPAVAWLPGVQDIKHCDEERFEAAVVAYGATSVESALEQINREGGAVPAAVVARFRGQGWESKK